jgi:UDP-4-amino-4,6-dideoxy-N-acetyl-beta-L-altrosamine transaminase
MSRFIPYSRQWIDKEDIEAVLNVLGSDFLTQGPKVKEFEDALSKYTGTGYAVAFSSGTTALHAAYFAAGIGPGDEIITSPVTFAATANAALYLGAKPVFVDVEPDTGNINPALIDGAVTKSTKAIVPVHYAGHPADMDEVHEIAKRHKIPVIEDACHALGAQYKGKKIGSISEMSVFSFHPVKPITTGEGGAVCTDDEKHYKKLLMFRAHGVTKDDFKNEPHGGWYYEMQLLGYNYRLTDIQAALGLSQLKKLDGFTQKRRVVAEEYAKLFEGNQYFDVPVERDYARSCWHLYPIRLKDEYVGRKKSLFEKLRSEGLGVQVHYIPVYLHPYYRSLGYAEGLCPAAEDFYRRELSIPIHQGMEEEDVQYVRDALFGAFEELK